MKKNKEISFFIKEDDSLEKVAILLSMAETKEEEDYYMGVYNELGYSCVITGASGKDHEVRNKLVNATMGAALNERIIEKDVKEAHALLHATAEACLGLKISSPLSQSLQLKIAIVRKEDWIAVSIYGDIAIHMITNHKTIGVGTMHI